METLMRHLDECHVNKKLSLSIELRIVQNIIYVLSETSIATSGSEPRIFAVDGYVILLEWYNFCGDEVSNYCQLRMCGETAMIYCKGRYYFV
jgi:hypothetical protein